MASKKPQSRREQEQAREREILRAALTELALFDYGGLTIEDVARRAGVNKTTVYRKWPTKSELVRAALHSVFELFTVSPSAGDLRSDLRRIAKQLVAFIESSEGKSLLRLRMLQHPEPELAEIARQLRVQKAKEMTALVETSIARGEMAQGVNATLLLDMLWGALVVKLVFNMEPIQPSTLEDILDLLITAAATTPRSKRLPDKASGAKKTVPRKR